MKKHNSVRIKKIFGKKTLQREKLRSLLHNSHWENFYEQPCGEVQFTVFTSIIESAIKKFIRKKVVFIRNDKSELTIHENWVKNETKKL